MRSLSARGSVPEDLRRRRVPQVLWGLPAAAVLLSVIGLATVHSASIESGVDYLPRQALWVGIGFVLMLVAFAVDTHDLTKFAPAIYLAGLVSLVAVLLVGQEAGGARSWLGTGSWRLQPSEFVRPATALLLARYLATSDPPYLGLGQIFRAGALLVVPMLLVAAQPDLGGAVMFFPMYLGMIVVSGVRLRYVVAAGLIALVLGGLAWNFVLLDYQQQRVMTFLSPESDPLGAGYQLRQSKIAVGSGELTGKGYLQGTQSQLRFLPARHTDFVFAVLAEEWGFLGVATVLALYALYLGNGFRVARRARDRVGILLVVGLLSTFAFYVLYNTAMVVGLLPITGIPLPFLSYGGSFTLANFVATGLVLGVDLRRHVNR